MKKKFIYNEKRKKKFEQTNFDGLLPILYCERRRLKKIVLQDTLGVLQDSECSGFSCVAIQWETVDWACWRAGRRWARGLVRR